MEIPSTITVHEYQKLIEAGILNANHRIELLEEQIVPKAVLSPLHASTRCQITDVLYQFRPDDNRIRIGGSIELADSQPEPDLAFVVGLAWAYSERHPQAHQTLLVIEITDHQIEKVRSLKGRIYARSGIPIYWIVNLIDNRIEVYTQPSGPSEDPSYASCELYTVGQSIPLVLDGVAVAAIPISDLLSSPNVVQP